MFTIEIMKSRAGQFGSVLEAERHSGKLVVALVAANLAIAPVFAAAQQPVLPQQSGVYLAQTLGREPGSSAGPAVRKSTGHRSAAKVVTGEAAEAGKNMGGMTTDKLYETDSPKKLPVELRDKADTLALQAAFAFENYARHYFNSRTGRSSDVELSRAKEELDYVRSIFSSFISNLAYQEYDVLQWSNMIDALYSPRLTPAEVERVAELAKPMAERLTRPGGPGYKPYRPDVNRALRDLAELRSRLESDQNQTSKKDSKRGGN